MTNTTLVDPINQVDSVNDFGNRPAMVYFVDEDGPSRESLAAVALSRGLQAQQYSSAEEFCEDHKDQAGQACLIVDVSLSGMSGLELLEKLRNSGEKLPTIVTTAQSDIATAVRAMQLGAVTFLQKPCNQELLWESIQLALNQAAELEAAQRHRQSLSDKFTSLTASERHVLLRVMEGHPNKKIATEMDIGLRTVELRRAQIMRKTGAASLSELIRLAIEAGFPQNFPVTTAKPEEAISQ